MLDTGGVITREGFSHSEFDAKTGRPKLCSLMMPAETECRRDPLTATPKPILGPDNGSYRSQCPFVIRSASHEQTLADELAETVETIEKSTVRVADSADRRTELAADRTVCRGRAHLRGFSRWQAESAQWLRLRA
jgi:hypothetical protein